MGFGTDQRRSRLNSARHGMQPGNGQLDSMESVPRFSFCQRISFPEVVINSGAINTGQEALIEIETMPQMSTNAPPRRELACARINLVVDAREQSSYLFKQRDAITDQTSLVMHDYLSAMIMLRRSLS